MNLNKITQSVIGHKKVIENYFFMIIIKFFNSFFYLLIYPFLIRILGKESLGLYLFAMSITTYFQTFISFGFDFPAIKIIALNPDNNIIKSSILSSVYTAKIYLAIISTLIGGILIFSINFFNSNWIIYLICFFNIIATILLPTWYFQGMQKMYYITIGQVIIKIIAIPFIFIFIKSSTDCWIFAFIMTISNIIGGGYAFYILKYKEKLSIYIESFHKTKELIKDSIPFFFSSSASIIKEQFTTLVIGSTFGMADVAIYDLANKIVSVPMNFIALINNALFPKVIKSNNNTYIKKIIYFELIVSITIISILILFGKYFILLMGGKEMLGSYPLILIISVILPCWLIVGCYIGFIYVPHKLYSYITKSQVGALILFLSICLYGIFVTKNIITIAIAMSLSGVFELVYNTYIIKRNKLLK